MATACTHTSLGYKLLMGMPLYSGVMHILGFDVFVWVWVLMVGEAMAQPWVNVLAVSLVGTVRIDE